MQRTEVHPTAGEVFGKGRTILEDIDEDKFSEERKKNIYFPFTDSDDLEVAAWLSHSGASMAHIDKFLKLPFVRHLTFEFELRLLICGTINHRSGGSVNFRSVPLKR